VTAAQRTFLENQAEFRLFVAGRGAGKSYAGALLCLMQPANSTGLVMAPTNGMLRDGAMKILLEIANRGNIIVDWHQTNGELKLQGNRTILFRSVENVNRVRGNNVGWLYFDEMCYMHPDVWPIALGTRRRWPMKVWATTTPNGMDFVHDIWKTDDPNFHITRSATSDNIFNPPSFAETLRSQMTEEQWRQEGLGEFITPNGALFNRSWFKYAEEMPANIEWYRYWDLAMTTKESSDYTASARLGIDDKGNIWLSDIMQIKAEYPEIKRLIVETMRNEPETIVGIEEAVSGFAAVQEIRRMREVANITLRGIRVDRDKRSRAMPWAAKAEGGQFTLKYAHWNRRFLDEVASFPKGLHDDMVDSVSGALQMASTQSIEWRFA
jgi:predicted phage terminase large subunit-like protein